ncbi:cytochrome P450 [Mycena floridula]|nr:cytochrome P450 [Mycena floridula]
MTLVAQLNAFNLIALGLSTWIISKLVQRLIRNSYATPLRGPTSSPSFLYGYQLKIVEDQNETATLYQDWAAEYGSVFSIPWIMGESTRTVLMDPKAIAHFYARGEAGYTQTQASRNAIARLFGNGIITAEGEVHRRQRKSLNPSFSPATIRGITSVFFDAAYKVCGFSLTIAVLDDSQKLKGAWDSQLDASTDDFATIEVQKWMTAVAIGMGGFSHDFGTLDGKQPLIATAMDSLGKGANRPALTPMTIIMGHLAPVLLKLPIGRAKVINRLKASLTTVGTELVDRVRKEQNMEEKESSDKSVIGALIKSSSADESMSRDEIQGQMNTLLVAGWSIFDKLIPKISDGSSLGYITTAVSMTMSYIQWALIELAKAQDKQEGLRKELLSLGTNDPTYDQLSSATALPYLDAVVHEILRLHPAVSETPRRVVSSIAIPKGALVVAPIRAMNTSETFWGPDAKEFRPERWLEGDLGLAKEIQAHHHIYTFITGPRECLGKTFALTEFKSVLSVLIRNYTFELPDGPKTKISDWRALLPKPNVEGQVEGRVPMIVRRIE